MLKGVDLGLGSGEMQTGQPAVGPRQPKGGGYWLIVSGACLVLVGLALISVFNFALVATSYGGGPTTELLIQTLYTIEGIGYLVQGVGFFLALVGIAMALRPRIVRV